MGGSQGFVILASLTVIALLSISACQKSADRGTYRIALGPWVGFGPLYLARDKGFFKEQNVNIDLILLSSFSPGTT
jgi:NitT/TauT family transport system substrate-binding protein